MVVCLTAENPAQNPPDDLFCFDGKINDAHKKTCIGKQDE
jgi:hypothetical protein